MQWGEALSFSKHWGQTLDSLELSTFGFLARPVLFDLYAPCMEFLNFISANINCHCNIAFHNHLVLIWFKGKVHQTAALTIYLHFCRNLLLLWYLLDCRYALWFSLHFNSNFTENHLHFKGFLMFKKSKHGSRVSRTRTTDMTSWDLGPHEEDLDKSQFSKMASGESF